MNELHTYEKTQNLNFITTLLHSTRYRNLQKIVKEVSTEKNGPIRIVDIGCGPAGSFEKILDLGVEFEYLGIELLEDFCDLARERYGSYKFFNITCDSIENQFDNFINADLIIGLESFEHIPEGVVVRTIEAIGKSNFSYFYLTVPNEVGIAILLKNVGSWLMGYPRYKEYKWSETLAASIYELDYVERHSTRHKGFDWRWLAQTLRQNVKVIRKTTSPVSIVPKFLSPSIGFVCVNDKRYEIWNNG